MAKELSNQNLSLFEQIMQTDDKGNEFWMARELSKVLEYTDFRYFSAVITKAKTSMQK
jgi:DNA-damage-inducible protein D